MEGEYKKNLKVGGRKCFVSNADVCTCLVYLEQAKPQL